MKIVVINGSPRKHGATASLFNELVNALSKFSDVEVQIYHVADMNMKFCQGCCRCYEIGSCFLKDDLEFLSEKIEKADGVILGSPTYACNMSAQMKLIIDRCHFVLEQLLYQKYAVSVITFENYGGQSSLKQLNQVLSYSGASISGHILAQVPFSKHGYSHKDFSNEVQKVSNQIYRDIREKHCYLFQSIKHAFIFRIGIMPFVRKKGNQYSGVLLHWKKNGILPQKTNPEESACQKRKCMVK